MPGGHQRESKLDEYEKLASSGSFRKGKPINGCYYGAKAKRWTLWVCVLILAKLTKKEFDGMRQRIVFLQFSIDLATSSIKAKISSFFSLDYLSRYALFGRDIFILSAKYPLKPLSFHRNNHWIFADIFIFPPFGNDPGFMKNFAFFIFYYYAHSQET